MRDTLTTGEVKDFFLKRGFEVHVGEFETIISKPGTSYKHISIESSMMEGYHDYIGKMVFAIRDSSEGYSRVLLGYDYRVEGGVLIASKNFKDTVIDLNGGPRPYSIANYRFSSDPEEYEDQLLIRYSNESMKDITRLKECKSVDNLIETLKNIGIRYMIKRCSVCGDCESEEYEYDLGRGKALVVILLNSSIRVMVTDSLSRIQHLMNDTDKKAYGMSMLSEVSKNLLRVSEGGFSSFITEISAGRADIIKLRKSMLIS